MSRKAWAWPLLTVAVAAAMSVYGSIEHRHEAESLTARIEQIVPVGDSLELSCADVAGERPFVILALGQSNAGNHGAPIGRSPEPVTLIAEGKCIKATAPLPGATGMDDSIWPRLPALLSSLTSSRRIVFSVLAVEATSIDDWTNQRSPLKNRLSAHVASMRRLDLAPNLVLWQQGEADALVGTRQESYSAGLYRLAAILNEAGTTAPIVLAHSTICRTTPNIAIRNAIEAAVANDHRFRLGPDTDTLSSDNYRNGCHLTADGLDSAAKMWSSSIKAGASEIRLAQ